MIAKEEAKELLIKFTLSSNAQDGSWMCEDLAKQCALISTNLLIKNTPSINIYPPNCQSITSKVKEYWMQVKKELEIL